MHSMRFPDQVTEYFSSVFITEDIRSLPVPVIKFEGDKSDYLGKLFVTSEMIVKEIKKMEYNKFHGVDGMPTKLFKEIVEQISISLTKVLNLSLEEGTVPSEWKALHYMLFKKGLRNKSENYRPVSLTSVVYKLLETFI